MITILRRRVACNIWSATLKVKVTAWPCSKIVSGPQLCYLKSDFKTITQKWSPYWDDVSRATFGSLPWRSRSQHDLAAKSCPALNFVIWRQILQLFYLIDHHIDTTCRAQHLGRYLEGQCHSMTFKHNCVRPITLLFEVDLKTISHEWSPYWDDVSSATFRLLPWRSRSQQDLAAKSCPVHSFVIWSRILQFFHHIILTCRALHLGRFLKVKVTAWPLSIIVSGR